MFERPATDDGWKDVPDLVGPTIRLNPSETARITVSNKLPEDTCVRPEGTHNVPHCFNVTNLHAHGLHVSPAGNSDNVLIEIGPGQTFEYEYNIPADHPAGTFWYHAHRHGSTALQVSSGMAGALIINGDRTPDVSESGEYIPGDIDSILPVPERILLLQQVQYACRDGRTATIRRLQPNDPTSLWTCEADRDNPDPVGGIEGYDQFVPDSWLPSGRYTLVNGKVQPVLSFDDSSGQQKQINAQVGQPERWRLIHAGIRDTIKLAIVKASQPRPKGVEFATIEQRRQWTADYCDGKVITQWEFATDGLTRAQISPLATVDFRSQKLVIPNNLQPGYRSDVLIVFPEPGDYCVLDEQASPYDTVNQLPKGRKLLATVTAEGANVIADEKRTITNTLVAAAMAKMPEKVRQRVVDDLNSDLKLTLFLPHESIKDDEVKGTQLVTFGIDVNSPSPADPKLRFGINHRAYDLTRIDRILKLGSADEWVLTSTLANHPFHIHVNPFQIMKILKLVTSTNDEGKATTEWKDLTDQSIDYSTRLEWERSNPESPPDNQYLNLRGVWKDTLLVKRNYRIYVRSRYERYIGDFVLHCHILDHEDQGMMENVRISFSGEEVRHPKH
jgi:FtsP/CotA-like multicopper oxidase with cupredoxin domain